MSKNKKLNVLWIMSDQHHAEAWGAGGRSEVKTPTLDRIAREGVRYRRAYCNNPICGPSRACFLTGQYISRHQVTGNNIYHSAVQAERNLAQTFKDSGYETALIGKGHLPKTWMEKGFGYRRYCDLADAERSDPRTTHYFNYLVEQGLGDEFDLGKLTADRPGSKMEAFVSTLPLEHSVEAWTGRETIGFLKQRDSSRPFFIQMSFQRPHDPYAPSPERAGLYDPERLPLPENASDLFAHAFDGKPAFQQDYVKSRSGEGYPYVPVDEADLKKQLAHYYALISMIDEQIGRVLDYLEETGELENTIIAYHADHGDFAGEHGLMLKNLGIYESIHRIPFILKYPGCRAGMTEDRMIESVDLFPTLCHLAAVDIPTNGDGHIIAGEAACFRSHVVCEWDFPLAPQSSVYAVRDDEYRLVYYPENPEDGELYHCATDPGETRNLFKESDYAEVRYHLLLKIFNQVSNYTRRHGRREDNHQDELYGHLPTRKIHKDGKRWSEVAGMLT